MIILRNKQITCVYPELECGPIKFDIPISPQQQILPTLCKFSCFCVSQDVKCFYLLFSKDVGWFRSPTDNSELKAPLVGETINLKMILENYMSNWKVVENN